MQRADESLFPWVYKEVGASLHTDPTGLCSLTLFRAIVQSARYPLAAYLAMRHNRAHVIALCAFLWAAATFLVGFSSTFLQEVKHPIMNKTSPCLNAVDWSSGNTSNITAANGMAEPELICENTMLPASGQRFAR